MQASWPHQVASSHTGCCRAQQHNAVSNIAARNAAESDELAKSGVCCSMLLSEHHSVLSEHLSTPLIVRTSFRVMITLFSEARHTSMLRAPPEVADRHQTCSLHCCHCAGIIVKQIDEVHLNTLHVQTARFQYRRGRQEGHRTVVWRGWVWESGERGQEHLPSVVLDASHRQASLRCFLCYLKAIINVFLPDETAYMPAMQLPWSSSSCCRSPELLNSHTQPASPPNLPAGRLFVR